MDITCLGRPWKKCERLYSFFSFGCAGSSSDTGEIVVVEKVAPLAGVI